MILIQRKNTYFFGLLLMMISLLACAQKKEGYKIVTGAEQTQVYLNLLKEKRIGIVANQTSIISKNKIAQVHLVDSLRSLGVAIKKVFAPEHGFRGTADAGEIVKDGIDSKTNLPVISLYGENKKPTNVQLQEIDLMVFDIQDVGTRFYTYISTLHYVMEACAENKIPLVILDRPNPNGHYIDGPILEKEHQSFVGMHPVPIVYGMTIGEYGQMINGEKWLNDGVQCNLTVIPLKNYTYNSEYSLPIKPSPNLPNDKSINLYPSLCLFEGTSVSVGRGTDMQFQVFGSPYLQVTNFSFTPEPNEGAKYPKHQRKTCYGEDLRMVKKLSEINLSWLIKAHNQTHTRGTFFNNFFTKLAGTKKLEEQIGLGLSEKEIKSSWKKGLDEFKKVRQRYLIYD